MDSLTIDEFKAALPPSLKKSVDGKIIKHINEKLADPDMYEIYRDNLLGYAHVMRNGKFKVSSYIDAVKYVSYKLRGKTNTAAYALTFIDKIRRWQAENVPENHIASYVAAYNKSKLVSMLMEQTLTPVWVMNQDLYQKAINHQAYLMLNAKSEKVQTDAANSLLAQLKPPETQKIELDIGVKKDSTIEALRASTQELIAQQRQMIQAGAMNAQQIAHQNLKIIDDKIEDAEIINE